MERGVYVVQFGGLTQLTAVDGRGRVVRQASILTELYTDAEYDYLSRWLDRVSPRGGQALKIV